LADINDVAENANEVEPGEVIRVCLFRIGEDSYAIPVDLLTEIITPQKLFPVPTTPLHVLGIINLRGNIVPIVDIRPVLSLPRQSVPGQIAIIKHGAITLGIVVDDVSEVVAVPESSLMAIPAENSLQSSGKSRSRFALALIPREHSVAALLNVAKIIDEIKLS
jgi:chemotaxis signal transduction protein